MKIMKTLICLKCKIPEEVENIKTTLEIINLGPKQIKFLINIKNKKK